jgi:DNA primase
VSDFIRDNSKDFIHFKIDLLLKETGRDPLKKVAVLKDFIESISLIPDRLTRLAYVKESADRMQMDEKAILSELNKVLRRKFAQKTGSTEADKQRSLSRCRNRICRNQPKCLINWIPNTRKRRSSGSCFYSEKSRSTWNTLTNNQENR